MSSNRFKNLNRFLLGHGRTIAFSVVALIIFFRRPDALLNPQPWAEDGTIFLAQALNDPVGSVFTTYAGYLHLIPRLVTLAALTTGFANAPLFMNLSALVLSALSISYFADNRFRKVVGNDFHRLLLCILFSCMPIRDIFLNITNIQWFLVVYATLWVTDQWLNYGQTYERSTLVSLLETLLVALAFLTSPLSLILAPAVFILTVRRMRDSGWRSANFSILGLACLSIILQAGIIHLASTGSLRIGSVTLASFAGAFSEQVVARLLAIDPSTRVGQFLISYAGRWPMYAVSLGIILPIAAGVAKKKDIAGVWFGVLALVALLFELIFRPYGWPAGRFTFLPMCLLLILIVRHVKTFDRKLLKGLMLLFLLGVAFSFAMHYEFTPFVNYNYKGYAAAYDRSGQWLLYAPINPPGWYMQLSFDPAAVASRVKASMIVVPTNVSVSIDSVNNRSVEAHGTVRIDRTTNPFIVLTGWVATNGAASENTVFLVVDNDLAFPTAYGMNRPDVAHLLGSAQYQNSGWIATISTEHLSGSHALFIWVISNGTYCDIDTGITIDIISS